MKFIAGMAALTISGVLFSNGYYAYGVLGLVIGGVTMAILEAHDK